MHNSIHSRGGRRSTLLRTGHGCNVGLARHQERLPHNPRAPGRPASSRRQLARGGVRRHSTAVCVALGASNFFDGGRRVAVDHVPARRSRRHALPGQFSIHWESSIVGLRGAAANRAAGMRGTQGRPAADTRLPITPVILRQLRSIWGQTPPRWDLAMLWAACTVAFFGFMRAGEFIVPSAAAYDRERHLSPEDVSADSVSDTSFVKVCIKQSKTDPFCRGVSIVLGRTQTDLCPVEALLTYLARRGFQQGPLFRFENGDVLSRAALVNQVQRALTAEGTDASRFACHSFRIGAATAAVARGLDDSTIRTLGRWKIQCLSA